MRIPGIICAFLFFVIAGDSQPEKRNAETLTAYVLGPDDLFTIQVLNAEEFKEKVPFRVDSDGNVNVPLIGRVRAAGLSISQFESEVARGLQAYYIHPQVAVSIVEFHGRPISVLGAVDKPGIQYLRGGEKLVEVIAHAGGPRADAGRTVTVSRRKEYGKIPVPNATEDPALQLSTVELDLNELIGGNNALLNISIEPHDVVTVSRADMVYVLGEVMKSGAFVVNNREEISVLRALAMAGGLSRTASAGSARILRRIPNEQHRQEIIVNLGRVVKSKDPDMILRSEDILYVPGSTTKKVALRTIEAAVGVGSSLAVWRGSQ